MQGKLFIVSAPSGAGKTSLVEAVLKNIGGLCDIERFVTYTSREIRPGEIAGRDFCYISDCDFETLINTGFFMEFSRDYGCYYGSPKYVKMDLERGKSRILVIDRTGALQIAKHIQTAVKIWINVDSVDVLRERLEKRGVNSDEQISKRLARAREEIEEEQKNNFYEYVVYNDVFEEAVKKFENILKKELQII